MHISVAAADYVVVVEWRVVVSCDAEASTLAAVAPGSASWVG